MSVFWVVAAMMMIVALIFLLPPLLRRESEIAVARDALNVKIYQDQLSELENDLQIGTVSAEQFEQAGRDLQRKLLEDVPATGHTPGHTAPTFAGRWTAPTIALLVPLLSTVLYLQLDNVRENPAAAQTAGATGGFSPEMMVQRLEQKLKENPADSEGWLRLARSYSVLERYADARDAYAKAWSLVDGNADLMADYAEAIVLSDPEQRITQQPVELFKKTLQLNANQPKALWFIGIMAFQSGDYPSAVTIWRRLEKLIPDDVEGAKVIRQGITEAESRAAQATGKAPDNTVKAKQ